MAQLSAWTADYRRGVAVQDPSALLTVGSAILAWLDAGGHLDEALQVLDKSAAAFARLGWTEQAEQIRTLQQQIRASRDADGGA